MNPNDRPGALKCLQHPFFTTCPLPSSPKPFVYADIHGFEAMHKYRQKQARLEAHKDNSAWSSEVAAANSGSGSEEADQRRNKDAGRTEKRERNERPDFRDNKRLRTNTYRPNYQKSNDRVQDHNNTQTAKPPLHAEKPKKLSFPPPKMDFPLELSTQNVLSYDRLLSSQKRTGANPYLKPARVLSHSL